MTTENPIETLSKKLTELENRLIRFEINQREHLIAPLPGKAMPYDHVPFSYVWELRKELAMRIAALESQTKPVSDDWTEEKLSALQKRMFEKIVIENVINTLKPLLDQMP